MNYEAYEPTIDLKDLLFHLMYRWRSILIVGLVFCLLLGGYKALKNFTTPATATKTEEEYEQEWATYELELAEYELDQKVYNQNIDTYKEWLDQQNRYTEKSVLMHTDPYNKPIATADFFVKLDDDEWESLPNNDNLDLNPAYSVLRAYVVNLYANIDWEPLEELTGVERLYLREIISSSADYNSNIFSVTVIYSDADTAQRLLNAVVEQIVGRSQTLMEDVAAHKLTILSQSLAYMIDNNLADTQKSNADKINTYEQYILDNRNKLEELVEPKEPEAVETKNTPITKGLIRFLVLGFAAGVFLTAGWYGVRYLLVDILRSDRELKERYGYQLLGTFSKPDRKGFLSFVDHLLEKMEGTDNKLPEETVSRCIAANITNLIGDKKEILLTGTITSEHLDKVAKGITSELKDIRLHVMANMNRNPETIKQLGQCDGVILVEERNVSKYSEIQVEQELAAALKIDVVGYIVL